MNLRGCSNLQNANGIIRIEERIIGAIRDDVVELATHDLGGLFCSRLDGVVLGEVYVDDVNVGALAQLCGNLLLGGFLSANETDDQVVGIGGYLL